MNSWHGYCGTQLPRQLIAPETLHQVIIHNAHGLHEHRFGPEEDAKNYLVTETGITIVTRDYSLFESPVPVTNSRQSSYWISK